jgi:hypothetical protein
MCAPMNTELPLNVGARMPEAREGGGGGRGGWGGTNLIAGIICSRRAEKEPTEARVWSHRFHEDAALQRTLNIW